MIAVIVNVAVCELVPTVAVIVAEVLAPDVCVVLTVNVPVVEPAGMVIDPELTVAEAEFDASVTVVVFVWTGVIVTVPFEE